MSARVLIVIEAQFHSFERLPQVIDQEERVVRHAASALLKQATKSFMKAVI